MILLNILQNFAVYLLSYFAHDNFSKWYISIIQDKLNALLLHNFTECFSMHHSKSSSKCFKDSLSRVFSLLFWAPWKMMFTKHLFDKKWMMMDIIDKNVFEIICYLLARFKTINLCSVHFIRFVNIFFQRRYGS